MRTQGLLIPRFWGDLAPVALAISLVMVIYLAARTLQTGPEEREPSVEHHRAIPKSVMEPEIRWQGDSRS